MKKQILLIIALFFTGFLFAQEDAPAEDPTGPWETGAGIGIDLTQLLQVNPRVGTGQNNLGLSGAVNFFAKYAQDRISWDNTASWQFGVQKIGAGPLPSGDNIPFQKSIDELRLNSKFGYKVSEDSKFSYATDFAFLSLIAPAYPGSETYPGLLLSNVNDTVTLAKFFSPATINLSLGIDFKPSSKLSFYYSPIAYKGIYVADDAIAELNVHGNEEGKNTFHNLGSLLRVIYQDKFVDEKIIFSSNLALFSNYLMEPQNVDIDWQNQLDVVILKNLSLTLLANLFYDHDVKVQITDYDSPSGVRGTGRRVSITEQLLLKYRLTF
jgi:hypothetical protein